MPSRPHAWNLARFDLVTVRLVAECVRLGSLSAAAQQMPLALAAASRRMRDLEETLGEPLFERHGRGLRPTATGRVFHRHALALLQSMEELAGELADLRLGVTRHLRLAASTAAIHQFLPPLLAEHARRQPQLRIDLQEQLSMGVVTALREGSADVGVYTEGVATAEGLRVQPFREDQLVLVLPRGHRLAGRTPLAFSDALDEDWISLADGAAALAAQQQAAMAAGRTLRLRMQVRGFDTVCHLVASKLGIALLPRAAAQPIASAMRLSCRPLSDAWAHRRILVATRAAQQEPAVEELAAFLATSGAAGATTVPSRNAKAARRIGE